MKQLHFHLFIILALILLVFLVYFPGLKGPYVLDDEENFVHNTAVAITEISLENIHGALTSNQSGLLKRPIAALSFALNHYFAGGFEDTLPFKLTNVVIHAINSILVYYLSLMLLRRPPLSGTLSQSQQLYTAGFISLLWALHPIQLTSVLYVVQRMNSLSAFFVILGLITILHGRQRLDDHKKNARIFMISGLAGGLLLGAGTKENAVLLPAFALVLEWTFYRREHSSHADQKWIWKFYFAALLLPLALFIFYLLLHPDFLLDAYAMRPFSLMERLLTEARVLWFYLSLILIPGLWSHSLFHDDIQISTGLLHPSSTFFAVVGIIALLTFALIRSRRNPMISFAILWYLAGHSLESSVLGLEIAHEHRNYLPSFGILFATAYAITKAVSNFEIKKNKAIVKAFPPLIIILSFGLSTWSWANTWKDVSTLAEYHIIHHPDSARANNFAARVAILEKNDLTRAIQYTGHGINTAPDEVGLRLDMRIFLAGLESDINSEPNQDKLKAWADNFPQHALHNMIELVRTNGAIKLKHVPSDTGTITDMLRDKPLSTHAVVALDKLTACIIDNEPACKALQDEALEWLDVAAMNPNTAVEYRALNASNAAKLHGMMGQAQQALDYMSLASKLRPGSVYYELGKAEYLIKLGRTDEAEVILNRAEESGVAISGHASLIAQLRKILTDAATNDSAP